MRAWPSFAPVVAASVVAAVASAVAVVAVAADAPPAAVGAGAGAAAVASASASAGDAASAGAAAAVAAAAAGQASLRGPRSSVGRVVCIAGAYPVHQSGYWEPLVQRTGETGHSRRCAVQRWAQLQQGSRRPLLIDY